MTEGLYFVNREKGTKSPVPARLAGRKAVMLEAVIKAGLEFQIVTLPTHEFEPCLFHPETGTDLFFEKVSLMEIQAKFPALLEIAYEVAIA